MTHPPSFSQAESADKKRITRREKFLTRMEAVIPWAKLLAVIEPFYPKGVRDRPPIGLTGGRHADRRTARHQDKLKARRRQPCPPLPINQSQPQPQLPPMPKSTLP